MHWGSFDLKSYQKITIFPWIIWLYLNKFQIIDLTLGKKEKMVKKNQIERYDYLFNNKLSN